MISRILKEDFNKTITNSDLLEDCIAWIAHNLSPEDVFSESDLEVWAEESGYVKKE